MTDTEILEAVMAEVGAGRRIPYLGPEVSALSGGQAPGTTAELCRRLEAEVRVPRRASGNLWSVAQYIESRKFRATLDALVRKAFVGRPDRPNPVHDWLASMRVPMVVDTWYDEGLLRAFGPGDGDWGLVQGISRAGTHSEAFTAAFDSFGEPVAAADPAWKSLLYKPNGLVRMGSSFLLSDADYVEVLTEIDIQTPIPEEVRERRTGRPFLFLGCRFDDQLLRIYARQITKRSGVGHVAVISGPLTRMEEKFLEELEIRRLDLPLSALTDLLTVPEG
ncbi:SIR2-like protein [Rhodobacter viridis]|uniref:SIR2-like protein n=1 Tax=Rhodobacter viridis TaxID=1054202 RepID=A0A318TYL4_9RHOB|nr:SIR2 family protein [Rhodobacter viridis]PYF09413.1 SIR2-like protein [Rhodobacter viridis]